MIRLKNYELKAQVLCCDNIVNLYIKENDKDIGKRFTSWTGTKPKSDKNSNKIYDMCPKCGKIYRFNQVLSADYPENFIEVTENS